MSHYVNDDEDKARLLHVDTYGDHQENMVSDALKEAEEFFGPGYRLNLVFPFHVYTNEEDNKPGKYAAIISVRATPEVSP